VMDGVADKAFTLSVLLTITIDGALGWAQCAALLSRDVVNASIAAYVGAGSRWELFKRVSARRSGKIATLFLFAMMIALLWRPRIGSPFVWAAMAASVASAVDYAVTFLRWEVWKVEPDHLPSDTP
jgi:phosphatidylglycerophosphate synthase